MLLKSGPGIGISSSEVRLICSLEGPEPVWTVSHIGGALKGAASEQVSVLVRNRDDSKVTSNALRFFYVLGYKLDHELLRVGFTFHIQRAVKIKVSVTSLHKIPKLHAIDQAVPMTPGLHLVEVSALTTSDTFHEAAAAISSFSEFLAPLLHLSKPGVTMGVVPTASGAAMSLMSRGNNKVP
eukprot:TRINITY_DN4305_c0_g1_i1.p1 TRINITY_DN4305_c0_g1~~TRINITY_DN4305_c0_g1_i1.p1  ORF type:complete len:182 (+),score=40.28 TRINITY_DN4305_c0_g1_i1:229-774(+)